jgi:polysaccharide biosynthesis protein PslH
MKVLFITHRFPYPPARGGKIRPFNIIKHLTSQGHEVTVGSLARTAEEALAGKGIAPYCRDFHVATVPNTLAIARMLARLPTTIPSAMGYFHSPELARWIDGRLESERFDLLFVHCAFMAPYLSDVRGTRKILDFGDMDSQKWREYAQVRHFPMSAGFWLEWKKMERAEARLASQFDLCTCTTPSELETLRSFGVNGNTDWFPNGVDLDYFRPTATPYEPDSMCFVGRMDYYPNEACMVEFCRITLPKIRARRPTATLTIVGADPPPAVRALAKLPGVTVSGSVPDVRPYVYRAAVSVAPLDIARGTQNKILETMAMGVPTVASVKAARGIDAEPEKHFLAAGTPDEFAEAVLRVIQNPKERARLSRAGRQRMESNHSWTRSMDMLDRLIN